jgi:hypothetical protein
MRRFAFALVVWPGTERSRLESSATQNLVVACDQACRDKPSMEGAGTTALDERRTPLQSFLVPVPGAAPRADNGNVGLGGRAGWAF